MLLLNILIHQNLNIQSLKILRALQIHTENYSIGDRILQFFKYYGDPSWWVIAHYNQKPTENLFSIGDVVYIPTPLTKVLEALEG